LQLECAYFFLAKAPPKRKTLHNLFTKASDQQDKALQAAPDDIMVKEYLCAKLDPANQGAFLSA
jgi:hypothetical protein